MVRNMNYARLHHEFEKNMIGQKLSEITSNKIILVNIMEANLVVKLNNKKK